MKSGCPFYGNNGLSQVGQWINGLFTKNYFNYEHKAVVCGLKDSRLEQVYRSVNKVGAFSAVAERQHISHPTGISFPIIPVSNEFRIDRHRERYAIDSALR